MVKKIIKPGMHHVNDHVNKAKHSMNPDRQLPNASAKGSKMRSRSTIKRLQMYRNFKPKRNDRGQIVRAAVFQSELPSGTMARVEPNRRWFGNTRVISQEALQKFKEAIKTKDPYQVVLRQTKLPISLLDEKKKKTKAHILETESFSHVFGKKSLRKRPRVQADDLAALVSISESRSDAYEPDKDTSVERDDGGVREEVQEPIFKAGQSRRLWNELFKVVDSADVILYVVDARDPMGTRSRYIEKYLATEKKHKHLILVMNKVDLVPTWITKRWKTLLSSEYPTIAFHADLTKPFGRNAMMSLLRQFAGLHKDKQQISVGVLGFPNVGKSSIINALRAKEVCKVAPIAGETKVWQYVTLMKNIYLIDCPGVVYPEGYSEAELVLKGVVRVENLRTPELYIDQVLECVKHSYLEKHYGVPAWKDANEFLELLGRRAGKLLKGGDPHVVCVAKIVLNDFQRGKLPYFVRPPGTENVEDGETSKLEDKISVEDISELNDEEDVECEEEKELANVEESEKSTVSVPNETTPEISNINDVNASEEESTTNKSLGEVFDLNADISDDEEENKSLTVSSSKKRKLPVSPDPSDDDEPSPRLTSKQRRRIEREQKPRKIGVHFYQWANVKNKNLAHKLEDSPSTRATPSPSSNKRPKNKKKK